MAHFKSLSDVMCQKSIRNDRCREWIFNRTFAVRFAHYAAKSQSKTRACSNAAEMFISKSMDLLSDGFEQALEFEGIPSNIIKRIRLEYGLFQFTKTDSKKVLGNMNDLVSLYSHFIYGNGGLKNCDLTEIIMRINKTPQKNIEWGYSIDALRVLFGLEKTPGNLL